MPKRIRFMYWVVLVAAATLASAHALAGFTAA
jgi:hypothetical protein